MMAKSAFHIRLPLGIELLAGIWVAFAGAAAAHAGNAPLLELARQTIRLPEESGLPVFADMNGDGLKDLFAIDPRENRIHIWLQRSDGFHPGADQVLLLPSQTAWTAVCDVDAHPGLELLASTSGGMSYAWQNSGKFETSWPKLIDSPQVFTQRQMPVLVELPAGKTGTNLALPIISSNQAVSYRMNESHEWRPDPAVPLIHQPALISVESSPWAVGRSQAKILRVRQPFLSKSETVQEKEPENEAIRKILADMKKDEQAAPPKIDRVDVNGDGKADVVLWQMTGRLDFKTDLYLFLRNADGRLSERPVQSMHCNGVPVPIGDENNWTPIGDLNADGVCECVLLEPRKVFASPSTLLEMAVTQGVEWQLTIRAFHQGSYSRSPDALLPVSIVFNMNSTREWPVQIRGDFNGDGRPDLLVKRPGSQWQITVSTADERWFEPQPRCFFTSPEQGFFITNDLNSDRCTDLIWLEPDMNRVSVFFMPQGKPGRGKP